MWEQQQNQAGKGSNVRAAIETDQHTSDAAAQFNSRYFVLVIYDPSITLKS